MHSVSKSMGDLPPIEPIPPKPAAPRPGDARGIIRDVILGIVLVMQVVTLALVAHLYWRQFVRSAVSEMISAPVSRARVPERRSPGAEPRPSPADPVLPNPFSVIIDALHQAGERSGPITVDYAATTMTPSKKGPSWHAEWRADLTNHSADTLAYTLQIGWMDSAGKVVEEIRKTGPELRITGGETQKLKGFHFIPVDRASRVKKVRIFVKPLPRGRQ